MAVNCKLLHKIFISLYLCVLNANILLECDIYCVVNDVVSAQGNPSHIFTILVSEVAYWGLISNLISESFVGT